MVKMVVFAPMPIASDSVAVSANSGLRARRRAADRTSPIQVPITPLIYAGSGRRLTCRFLLERRIEFGWRLDPNAVAERRQEVAAIVGHDDSRVGRSGDLCDVGVVNPAAEDPVARRGAQ